MSSLETLGGLERRLNVSIPQDQLRGEMEIRLKRVGRTAKVAGFRPGKIPVKILEQQYGAQIHQEVLGEKLQSSFFDAAEANNLHVAGYPKFELKTADLNAPTIEYSATFEVYPEVTIGDISAESVVREAFVLADADVEKTINTMRKQRAVFTTVDRATQNHDQVRIDFTGTLDGVAFEGGEAKDIKLELGVGRMLPDFEAGIIGAKAGETKSFELTFPEDYHGKDVAGKQVTFAVTVHQVEEPVLPELDAEFAKSLGVADGDVEKLKVEIRSNLNREAQRRIKVRNKDHAMEALLKVGVLDVPKSLVESESQNLMQQSRADMEARGIKLPADMKLPLDLFAERATKRVKLGLILSELVTKHELAATSEQVKALLTEYAESYQSPAEVIRWYTSDPSRIKEIENLALEDNVVAWVMAGANVVDQSVGFDALMENN
jgi:trigger factor